MNRSILFFLFASILFSCKQESGTDSIPDKIDFNVHIRPILSDRCYKCHGPDGNKRQGNLRLDISDSAYAELKEHPGTFAIKKNDVQNSQLYHRIYSTVPDEMMPPPESNLKLNDTERKLLTKWIEQGAEYKPHWAFIPPQKPKVPSVNNTWIQSDIDRFIFAALKSKGLGPNEKADKETLLKRVSFDLTGLPPTLEMQQAFLNDKSDSAYSKMVDQLLANKHYGEKMALPWLDAARYADSHGYQDDGLRTMWPWRDWVIHAFNENYSYKKFATWQLGGDLIPDANKEMILATGFNRNHKITQEGGVIDEEYRVEYVTDRTNTFGKTFLAMTFECSKCHDHKYDPIKQKEYFSTFAFFNQVNEKGLVGDIGLASLADPPKMYISDADVRSFLKFINKKDTIPVPVMIMKDSSVVRTTYILKRGQYDQHGDSVDFTTPVGLFAFDTLKYKKNRLGLAEWLFDEKNPFTARVFVNRIWQEFFGRGIVKTAGDFGMQGEAPSHPELLDWLAIDFMEHGWDIKRLVKQIVTSATYTQSSAVVKKNYDKDPDNVYLSRYMRSRLPAEFIKDHVMASSGLLNDEIGGPSVKPYQPQGIWESSTSGRGQLAAYVQDHGKKLYRRGMYTFIKRTAPPPSMLTFDASNRDQCEVRRVITNTPLQALVLLNDPQVVEASRVLAQKLIGESSDIKDKIEKSFRLILCRKSSEKEKTILQQYFDNELKKFQSNPSKAASLLQAGEYILVDQKTKQSDIETAALMQVIHTIYNMEEAIVKG